MRTTVSLDDDLLSAAPEYTDLKETSALVNEALRALVQREAAHRLAKLGGSDPAAWAPARRRPAEAG